MKLWFQSSGALDVDPRWADYRRCLSEHLRKFAREDTEIELHGSKVFSPGIISHAYDAYLQTSLIIEGAIEAERTGYDGFIETCGCDLGYLEIREVIDMPVVFAIESALHIATLLAPKVAFLTIGSAFLSIMNERAKSYGFQERLTVGRAVNLTPGDILSAFKNPGPTIEVVAAEAKKINEQGANMLICSGLPLTMLLVSQGVTELGGVRVLDGVGILVKVAEMMVDLHKMGINRSKMGSYSPLPKDELRSTRKLFGVE